MHVRSTLLIITFFFLSSQIQAQAPAKPNSAEIYAKIEKLNFLGSVLYVAAHPDDENTRLISYMANAQKARTGYLSLTRGDGGQNLIGPELREFLGVIRTQELIEARKVDGGEQFFSRANDFGYSKIPTETLKIWNEKEVLGDMVYIIRKFQPDVIINRFDYRTPGTTHGHHTSSAILAQQAFDLVNDKNSYSDQLNLVQTWQPKRMYFNTSWWFYGTKDKFDSADKTNLANLTTGVYYQSLGKSNQEIAALSRSRHQSQGFGTFGVRGDDMEYLEFIKGEKPKVPTNLFEGIDTSWNRVEGGKTVGNLVDKIIKEYNFKNPSASISDLVKAYQMIQNLKNDHWKELKSKEIKDIIASCAGLYLETVAENQSATPDSDINLNVEAVNRSAVSMTLESLTTLPENVISTQNIVLKDNVNESISLKIHIPKSTEFTAPYWLKEQGTVGMYRVDDQKNIGKPDIIRDVKTVFNIKINDVLIPFERTVIYKFNDPVAGEVYRPFDIEPLVSTSFTDKVKIFSSNNRQNVTVKVHAGAANLKGTLKLDVPKEWMVNPETIPFSIALKGESKTYTFEVTPPKSSNEVNVKAIAVVNDQIFDKEKIMLTYNHISHQQVLQPSVAKFIKLDIKTGTEKIAYIMGAGDEVPVSLQNMGYSVTIVKPAEISAENLQRFDVIMLGIRAYNTVEELEFKQAILLDLVEKGKTMIVQYNTTGKLVTNNLAPFPLKLSRDRVTEEDAKVTFLAPAHPVLNTPNKITSKDFENWVQEQGLYYPDQWDKAFVPIISSHDENETPKNGALLVAPFGKGYYIYTGLSFFRELPAGVSGAHRLLANLISLKNEK
ncbi:PIG-L family deacetylase [Flavobacterium tegetincola]|uniref:PIG-L family deacetylase n=1 Tax=Flavobacterium tegetincola TaxID=150172 RepID=UPI00047ADFC1|nr:PIG-L family deacetylase [Flavobacterium tegetincola]